MIERFPGKHLGTVTDNADPKSLGRVRARVPEIFADEETGWCLPCSPYAGSGVGFAAVPPVGSIVFVEWPGGDTTRPPIWSGALWGDGDGVQGASPDAVVLLTPAGNKVLLNDASGSEAIELTAASGAKVTLDQNGVTVEIGSSKLALTQSSISLNDGALEVQ